MKKEKVLVYYHSVDLDGCTSGALVNLLHPLLNNNDECDITLKGWTYSREEPELEKITGYDYFYLVDLGFSIELTKQLFDHYGDKFLWIDHHEQKYTSFYESEIGKNIVINGIQDKNHAACLNVWKYFYIKLRQNNNLESLLKMFNDGSTSSESILYEPSWLILLDNYDRWFKRDDKFWNDYVMPFQYFMRSKIHNAENMIRWINDFNTISNCAAFGDENKLSKNEITQRISVYTSKDSCISECINKGLIILVYQNSLYKKQHKTKYDFDFHGYKACVINTQDKGSTLFESLFNVNKYDIFIPWYYDGNCYNYSMYTFRDDINCAELCAKYLEGGGHVKAAGGKSKDLIFKNI